MEPTKLKTELTKEELLKQLSTYFNYVHTECIPCWNERDEHLFLWVEDKIKDICSGKLSFTDENIKKYESSVKHIYEKQK